MSRRFHDWPEKMNATIEDRRVRPFAWGTQDCCLFAADVVLAMTGSDLAADLRGRYKSRLGAQRIMKRLGGVEAIACSRCSEDSYTELGNICHAQRGDVVLIDVPGEGPAVGICVGSKAAFAGPNGLEFPPMSACRRAWRIA